MLEREAEERIQTWVKKAGRQERHCFLSQLVRDLGRQYEEAKQQQGSGESSSSACPLYPNSLLLPVQVISTVIREGRSFSASAVLQAPSIPTKAVYPKKSPKLWPRRNAYVTPLNGPATLYGEWPLVGSDPLVEFSKLHYHYGQEVKKARDEWLRSRQPQEDNSDRDLIDLE
nr:LOW QUALITY PROTEIN: sesquipedalian-1 [Nothobranchius furzeri]